MIQAQNPQTSNHGKKYVIKHQVSGRYWNGLYFSNNLKSATKYLHAPINTVNRLAEIGYNVMALQAFINL